MAVRTMIVDDEPLARAGVRVLLRDDADIEIVGEYGDAADAADSIATLAPDLLFLDIRMPGMDGFDMLRHVRDEGLPVVVFVTAFDEHALRAFAVNALDYVLKPIDEDRFSATLQRAKAQVRRLRLEGAAGSVAAVAQSAEAHTPSRFIVRHAGRVTFVPAADVDWIEAADYYARLHAGSDSHLLRESLTSLEARLGANEFFRVHRTALVRLDRVAEIRTGPRDRLQVVLRNGVRLRLSRRRRAELEARLARSR